MKDPLPLGTTQIPVRTLGRMHDRIAELTRQVAAYGNIARAIHYPECWDTAAYPTLADALGEIAADFTCSNLDTHPGMVMGEPDARGYATFTLAEHFYERIASDKDASIAFLKRAGILNEAGELAEPYRTGELSRNSVANCSETSSSPMRECANGDCGWRGTTTRMLGAIGPLCPECGEITELAGEPLANCDGGQCGLGGYCADCPACGASNPVLECDCGHRWEPRPVGGFSDRELHEMAEASGFSFAGQWMLYQAGPAQLAKFAEAILGNSVAQENVGEDRYAAARKAVLRCRAMASERLAQRAVEAQTPDGTGQIAPESESSAGSSREMGEEL
jgi:hypothetical protein